MAYQVRVAQPSDLNELVDIDIKCYEDAWPLDRWRNLAGASAPVITWFGTPVGVGVFRHASPTLVEIEKLAVKPGHRRMGFSRVMLRSCAGYARQMGATHALVYVPERQIYPGPGSLGDYLRVMGFKAHLPFVEGHFTYCGEPENGVRFLCRIEGSPWAG